MPGTGANPREGAPVAVGELLHRPLPGALAGDAGGGGPEVAAQQGAMSRENV
jgi:hypothetical protein